MNTTELTNHLTTALNAIGRAETQCPEVFNETATARQALRAALAELQPKPQPQPSDEPMLIDGQLKSIRDIFGDGAPLREEKPQPARDDCNLRAMRCTFATARERGLDATKGAEMKAALGRYFGRHFESRRELTRGMWIEATRAIAVGELAW